MKELVDTWFNRAGALPLSFTWFGGLDNVQMLNATLCRHQADTHHVSDLRLRIYLDSTSRKAGGVSFLRLQSLNIAHRFVHPMLTVRYVFFD
jgi:hypothetical protein